tara:strand:- start:888 stop:1940 length:1053 start_codon:yes stop_codon:yes gene_type:complete
MLPSADHIIHIPLLDALEEKLDALTANKKKKRATRKAIEKIQKYLPELTNEYSRLYSLVGHKLRLIPTLTHLIEEWGQKAGQHICIELLTPPPEPKYQAKLIKVIAYDESLVKAESDSRIKSQLSEALNALETMLEYTIEMRVLHHHQTQINNYCRGLYEMFRVHRAQLEKNLETCQVLEGQIVALLHHHRILTPEQATRARETMPALADRPLDPEQTPPRPILKRTRPTIRSTHNEDEAAQEKPKPSFLMRVWLFFKNIVVSILNFIRKIPPISWIFPLRTEAEIEAEQSNSLSDEGSRPVSARADALPDADARTLSTSFRGARRSHSRPHSNDHTSPTTPKTLRNRAR